VSEYRLPQFLVGGAQKAGSTWLAEMLSHHPALYVPAKEVHFFDLDQNYARGPGWYSEHFSAATDGQLCGEKTPDYLLVEKQDGTRLPAAQRIREMLPDVKLLLVLRNPVTRAVSALRHHLWFRRFPISAAPEEILFGKHRDLAEEWSILSHGLYSVQLRHYFDLFPAEQIRVWIFEEDMKTNPLQLVRQAASFIGVSEEDATIDPNRVSNRGVQSAIALRGHYYLPFLSIGWQVIDRILKQKFNVSQECLNRLIDHYSNDVDALADLLGRDLSIWQA